MNESDLANLWQSQSPQGKLSKRISRLVLDVEHDFQELSRMIFWRDLREVGVAVVLLPVWVVLGVYTRQLWTWYLMIPALFWVIGFFAYSRFEQNKRPLSWGAPLKIRLQEAREMIGHQIWLLKNVAWWYLAPILGVLLVDNFHWYWIGVDSLTDFLGMTAFFGVGGWVMWALNQRVVRKGLGPQKERLENLLKSMAEDG